jgi:hypothetical protein
MPIKLDCFGCNATYTVPDHFAGRSGKCKHCGTPLVVPGGNKASVFVPVPDQPPVIIIDDGPRPRRTRKWRALNTFEIVCLVIGFFVLGEAVIVLRRGDSNEIHEYVMTCAKISAWMIPVFPLVLPAVYARRGVLSSGRWVAASGFCLTMAVLCALIVWGCYSYELVHPGPSLGVALLQAGSFFVGIGSAIGVPGCMLAAVLHRPRV